MQRVTSDALRSPGASLRGQARPRSIAFLSALGSEMTRCVLLAGPFAVCGAGTTRRRARSGCRCAAQQQSNAALSRDEAEGSLQWRYEWADEGAVLASSVRAEFAANVARGEAALDGALAALQVAAEDDALMSITGVPLPVEPYLQRLERMSYDLHACLSESRGEAPHAVVNRADALFYNTHRFRSPPASAGTAGVVLDMPGVHSDPRQAYAHNALTTKVALPPLLAILYADVWRRVQARGGVDFSIGMRLPDTPWEAPQAVPLPHLTTLGAGVVNTWPAADALVQLLRHLKRCYWTHSWDTGLDDPEDGPYGSGGGFLGAAESLLGGDQAHDAATTAIARTAAHRLARGIWTSSGGGDIRRARASCERLVLLLDQQRRHGDSRREAAYARERRDLGVLILVSGGDAAAAAMHLEACAACAPAMAACTAAERSALERLIQALPQLESAPAKPRRRGLPW